MSPAWDRPLRNAWRIFLLSILSQEFYGGSENKSLLRSVVGWPAAFMTSALFGGGVESLLYDWPLVEILSPLCGTLPGLWISDQGGNGMKNTFTLQGGAESKLIPWPPTENEMKTRKYERLICDIDWSNSGAKILTFYTWFFPAYLWQIIALHPEEYRSRSDKNFELDFGVIGRLQVPDLTDPATQLFWISYFSCIFLTLI